MIAIDDWTVQLNSATLMYDLNTMKGPMASYLKKVPQPFKIVQFKAKKIHKYFTS